MAWILAEDLCKERFGMSDQAPEFQDMMSGFYNKIYEMDKKMWEFAQEAECHGAGSRIQGKCRPNAIIAKLQESEKGKEWFKAVHELS